MAKKTNRTLATKGLTKEQRLEYTYQNFLKEVERETKRYERHGVNIGKVSTDFLDFKASRNALIKSGRYDKIRKNIARQLAEEAVQPYTQKQFDALMAGFYQEVEVKVDGQVQKKSVLSGELKHWLKDYMQYDEEAIKALENKDVKNKDKRAEYIKFLQKTYKDLKEAFPEIVEIRKTEEIGSMISEYFFGS